MKTLTALEMLRQDHEDITKLFAALHSPDGSGKPETLKNLTILLHVHSDLEEEVFYPTAENILGEEEWIRQALEDHAAVKELLMEIERLGPGDEKFAETIAALEQKVREHAAEEESLILPRLEKAPALNQEKLAAEMLRRRRELEMEYAA